MTAVPRGPGVRERSAQATRDAILRAATKVFARHGYAGGKVEQISKAAKSHDRMIYYYFGSKEGLFIAVLEEMYRRFNEAEAALALDDESPVDALRAVIRFMMGYYQKHPEFITLLNTENLHRGRHIAKSLRAREYSSPAVDVIGQVLARGAKLRISSAADLSCTRHLPDDRVDGVLLPVEPLHLVRLPRREARHVPRRLRAGKPS